MPDRADDWIAELWQQVREQAAAKVAVVVRAAAEARAGPLAEATRAEAWQEAHRLAGSLGTYGHHDAADAAAELERLLDGPVTPDAAERLDVLAARLVAVVEPASPAEP